jgi:hypothetical protein
MRVSPPASLPTLDPRADTYDSIGMILFAKKGNPYYGDTTVYQNYVVNQIDTIFQLPDGRYSWFSNNSLPLGPDLGSTSVRIFPNQVTAYGSNTSQGTGDTVRIPMDYNLGQQLYNMVYNRSDTLTNSTIWQRWFHGLCISPGGAAAANYIYGFRGDSAIMRIYYRENGVVSTGKFIDFNLTDKGYQFNGLTTHYGGKNGYIGKSVDSLLRPKLNPQVPPVTLSSKTGNAGFVQTIGGLNVKLTFPYLNSIALRQDYIGLLRATLIVKPVPGSYSTTWRLPPQVGVYATDLNNLIGLPISAIGVGGTQTGNLQLDYSNPLNTQYTYDVTSFIKTQILNQSATAAQTGLILSVPAPANTSAFNRLIVADQSWPVDRRVTLKVYYISLYPHQ